MTATAAVPPGPQHHAAMAQGARCDLCPLVNLGRGPVPSTRPGHATFGVVAEAPGASEVAQGQVLVGASGREIRSALSNAGVDTSRVAFMNALGCQPPGDLKAYLRQCKKQGLPSPIDMCRPRLEREMQGLQYVVLMGGASLGAVGLKQSVMQVRGTPLTLPNGTPGMAIPHAAFVLRDEGRTFRPLFHADVNKAVRLSRGGNTWKDPWYFVPKSAAEVDNFLQAQQDRTAVDVETDGIDTWTCNLRRIGIGNAREVMIYSPLSVHGHWMLNRDEIIGQARAIANYFQRAPRLDTHNGVVFDSVVLYRHGMPMPDEKICDSLIAHQIGQTSELPHSLDFLASIYTDAPSWKSSFKHSNVRDDAMLDRYLSFDIATTWSCMPYVEQNLLSAQQMPIYSLDKELFQIGRSMSAMGLYVDQAARMKFAVEYQEKADRMRKELADVAGRDVNPNSPPQIRNLLYHDLGLPALEEHVTDSGDPSTDEGTLLDLLSLGVDERARKVIHGVLGCREAEKILGTYTGHVVDGRLEGGPLIHTDGCVRPVWRPGKRSGRWGSNDPNAQNIGKKLRAMYIAKPGNVLVAADMQAVELRMIAWLANDAPLIEAFRAFDAGTGPDVHIANACTVFKCTPDQVKDEIRTFIKRFVYALNYDAEPPKIYQTLSLLRDDNLRPMFPDITLAAVERLYTLWWQLHPAIPEWKKKLIYGWRSTGSVATKIGGRKRMFVGGEKPTEIPNHDVQGSSASMQNESIRAVVRGYPFDFVNHRGLLVNGHDQIMVECAEHEQEDVKRLVQSCMERTMGAVKFPAEPKVGPNWKVVS